VLWRVSCVVACAALEREQLIIINAESTEECLELLAQHQPQDSADYDESRTASQTQLVRMASCTERRVSCVSCRVTCVLSRVFYVRSMYVGLSQFLLMSCVRVSRRMCRVVLRPLSLSKGER
jgi:hypothetical protein